MKDGLNPATIARRAEFEDRAQPVSPAAGSCTIQVALLIEDQSIKRSATVIAATSKRMEYLVLGCSKTMRDCHAGQDEHTVDDLAESPYGLHPPLISGEK